MSTVAGTLFDGRDLTGRPATLELIEGDSLRVVTATDSREMPFSLVQISDRLGDIPRFVTLPDRALFETMDNQTIDDWLASRDRGRAAALIHFLESHRGFASVACLLVVATLLASLYYGPPRLARSIAYRVPPKIEQRAGEVSLKTLRAYTGESGLTKAERTRVQDQLARLLADRPATDYPQLVFVTLGTRAPNAFALPGRTLIVSDELVRLPATDDELAAVLAHELGHLERRHGLQSVLRNSFALLIVSAVTGDLSTLTSFASALPLTILTNGYSRDLEREADRYARDLLRQRHIPTKGFSTLLLKLETARVTEAGASYLSTHPSDDERMAFFGTLTPSERDLTLAQGTSAAKPVFQPPPLYPYNARAMNKTGTVTVSFTVDASGNVQNPTVHLTTDPIFDAQAIAAIQRWRFQPARKDFHPVEAKLTVPIVFTLTDEPASKSTATTLIAPASVPAKPVHREVIKVERIDVPKPALPKAILLSPKPESTPVQGQPFDSP